MYYIVIAVVIQSLSHVQLFLNPWTAARQASLSITNSRGPPKPMSIESVMPSNHFILCCPLLLPPSVFPSIRIFSSESVLHIKWPKYWSFSFNIIPSNEHSGLISFRMDWLVPLAVQGTIKRNQGFRIPKINIILPQLNMAKDREESKGINLHTIKEDKLPRKANSGFSS